MEKTLCAGAIIAFAVISGGCSSPSKPSKTLVFDPPVISCPETQTVRSLLGDPVPIAYGDATASKGKRPVTVACDPPVGSPLPIGDTTVTCVATDSIQRASSCTFLVTVLPPLRLSVTRFVAFGDSITWGEDGQSLRVLPGIYRPFQLIGQTYPDALSAALTSRYPLQSVTMCNAGNPGEALTASTIPDNNACHGGGSTALERFGNIVASGQYDAILLMEGSNDVPGIPGDSLIVPNAKATLQQMLHTAKSRGVRPYLATIPPKNADGSRGAGASYVPGFNDMIRTLAMSEGVPLVDVYPALNPALNTDIGNDGLHPTAAGYAKIANLFLSAIADTLEVQGTNSLRGRLP